MLNKVDTPARTRVGKLMNHANVWREYPVTKVVSSGVIPQQVAAWDLWDGYLYQNRYPS
jgi:hypothetical protein